MNRALESNTPGFEEGEYFADRRFSDFEHLHKYLANAFPSIILPVMAIR